MVQLTDKISAVIAPFINSDRYFKLWNDINDEWVIECQREDGNDSTINNLGNIDEYYIIGTIDRIGNFSWDLDDFTKGLLLEVLLSKGINIKRLNNEKILILQRL